MNDAHGVWVPASVPCVWDDDGFKLPCGQWEEDHCPFKGADDDCKLLHHPFTLRKRLEPVEEAHPNG